tara:strand:- start:19522 stop:20625 length:1104 start_codon:yes stop_codon:yes gene_type:complete
LTKRLIISDTFDFAPSTRVYTDEGFLRVSGKAARTGVYKYLARELGLNDRKPNEIVNVLRHADEVFNVDSLSTYSNSDVTNDHPLNLVTTVTYKGVSVGHVIDAKQSGDFVDVNIIVKDAEAIADIESGKSQLSPGYTAVYVPELGIYDATGETYEFKQTGIEINHVAIVKRGRGGAQVRIDDNQGKPTMIKVMLDSGLSLEVADDASATLVTDAFQSMTQKVVDAESKADKAEAEKEDMKEKLDEEKKKSSDSAISERVQLIAQTMDQARKIVGDSFVCESVDISTIQRTALAVKRPTVDWAAKSDAYLDTAFELSAGDAEIAPADNAEQLAKFSKDAANVEQQKTEPKLTRDQAYAQRLSNEWSK